MSVVRVKRGVFKIRCDGDACEREYEGEHRSKAEALWHCCESGWYISPFREYCEECNTKMINEALDPITRRNPAV